MNRTPVMDSTVVQHTWQPKGSHRRQQLSAQRLCRPVALRLDTGAGFSFPL